MRPLVCKSSFFFFFFTTLDLVSYLSWASLWFVLEFSFLIGAGLCSSSSFLLILVKFCGFACAPLWALFSVAQLLVGHRCWALYFLFFCSNVSHSIQKKKYIDDT